MLSAAVLTERRLRRRGEQQQAQLVQRQRDMHGVRSQPLDARQELDGRLQLAGQQQHAEVERRLVVGVKMALACRPARGGGDISHVGNNRGGGEGTSTKEANIGGGGLKCPILQLAVRRRKRFALSWILARHGRLRKKNKIHEA